MGSLLSILKNLFLRNKGAKAASIVLAVIVWYAIQAAISNEAVVADVPVTLVVDPGWAILDRSVKTVDHPLPRLAG